MAQSKADWIDTAPTPEVATALELIAHQSPADVNYYVFLEAAKRLRAYALHDVA